MSLTQIFSLILLPILLAGAHGYFTNWLAVKLLLKPVKPVNILGFKLQGLLPRRQADLADRISEAIAREFLTEKDITAFLSQVDPRAALHRVFLKKWEDNIDEIMSDHPFIKMFLSTEKLNGIRDKIAEILTRDSGALMDTLLGEIEGKIDLRDTLRRNILAFDVAQLNDIIEEIGYKEFSEIAWIGGVLGVAIGVVQAVVNVFFLR